jgi:outer membrane protein assembly factor BamA
MCYYNTNLKKIEKDSLQIRTYYNTLKYIDFKIHYLGKSED